MDGHKSRLAVRTVLVSYLAAARHAENGDREPLRRRALEMLDVVAERIGPGRGSDVARLMAEARETILKR